MGFRKIDLGIRGVVFLVCMLGSLDDRVGKKMKKLHLSRGVWMALAVTDIVHPVFFDMCFHTLWDLRTNLYGYTDFRLATGGALYHQLGLGPSVHQPHPCHSFPLKRSKKPPLLQPYFPSYHQIQCKIQLHPLHEHVPPIINLQPRFRLVDDGWRGALLAYLICHPVDRA